MRITLLKQWLGHQPGTTLDLGSGVIQLLAERGIVEKQISGPAENKAIQMPAEIKRRRKSNARGN
jgi:hypothetical protein